jgi:hypothetical protein
MSKWKGWLRRVVVATVLLLICLVVTTYLYERSYLRPIEVLAAVPTPESEPKNPASYYLDAAPFAKGPSEELLKTLDEADIGSPEKAAAFTTLNELVASNAEFFSRIKPARTLKDCRMPLLSGPGPWGMSEYQAGDALRRAGDVLFCSTLLNLHECKYLEACEDALLNLQLGRDVTSIGGNHQSGSGGYIYRIASCSLGIALTQYPLDAPSLAVLQAGLPDSHFPPGFDKETVHRNNDDWRVLANHRHSLSTRILQDLHIRLPRYTLREFAPSFYEDSHENPLLHHGESLSWRVDAVEGLRSGIVMAQIGVAVRSYLNDLGRLPSSLADLVPRYMPAVPLNPTGIAFEVSANETKFEIVSPGDGHGTSRRSLRFVKIGAEEKIESQ